MISLFKEAVAHAMQEARGTGLRMLSLDKSYGRITTQTAYRTTMIRIIDKYLEENGVCVKSRVMRKDPALVDLLKNIEGDGQGSCQKAVYKYEGNGTLYWVVEATIFFLKMAPDDSLKAGFRVSSGVQKKLVGMNDRQSGHQTVLPLFSESEDFEQSDLEVCFILCSAPSEFSDGFGVLGKPVMMKRDVAYLQNVEDLSVPQDTSRFGEVTVTKYHSSGDSYIPDVVVTRKHKKKTGTDDVDAARQKLDD